MACLGKSSVFFFSFTSMAYLSLGLTRLIVLCFTSVFIILDMLHGPVYPHVGTDDRLWLTHLKLIVDKVSKYFGNYLLLWYIFFPFLFFFFSFININLSKIEVNTKALHYGAEDNANDYLYNTARAMTIIEVFSENRRANSVESDVKHH